MIAPAGPVSLPSEVLILNPLKDKRSFHSVPSAQNVSDVSALISLSAIRIDVKNGNLIGLRSMFPAKNVNPRMQLSTGHSVLAIIFFPPLVKSTEIFWLIYFLSTLQIFQTSTGSLLIERMVSPDNNPICCPRRSDDTVSIFAGEDTKSQLMNPCFRRKFTVGIR